MNAASFLFEEGARDAKSEVRIGGFPDLLYRRVADRSTELPERGRGSFEGLVKALNDTLPAVSWHRVD